MRQANKILCDWDSNDETDIDYRDNSMPIESSASKLSIKMQAQYPSLSNEPHIYRSNDITRIIPPRKSSDETRDNNQSADEATPNFLNIHLDNSFARRKESTCSDTSSSDSTNASLDGSTDGERNSSCYTEYKCGHNKYEDIIDKIVGLRFSANNLYSKINSFDVKPKERSADKVANKNIEDVDYVNGNWDAESKKDGDYWEDIRTEDNDARAKNDDDNDLIERGPVRPQSSRQSRHSKPYTWDWIDGTSPIDDQNQSYTSDYDSTAVHNILMNKQYSAKINPCLDKLSDFDQSNGGLFNITKLPAYDNFNSVDGWPLPEANYADNGRPNSNISNEDIANTTIPSIVLSDPNSEAALMEIMKNGGFQAAQTFSDTASLHNSSPGAANSEIWPDSPASSYNVLSSRPHSRASSRAQSPGSGTNMGSPLLHVSMLGSPSEYHTNAQNFRCGQVASSSESSNHSYADTPSPLSYQSGIDQRSEEELGLNFGSFSTWCKSCVSSDTVVNSAETIDGIDNNELQLVEEVIRRDQVEIRCSLVPESHSLEYDTGAIKTRRIRDIDLVQNSTTRRNCGQISTIENIFDESVTDHQDSRKTKIMNQVSNSVLVNDQCQVYHRIDIPELGNTGSLMTSTQNVVYPDLDDVYNLSCSDIIQNNVYNGNPLNSAESLMDFENSMENFLASHYANSDTGINDSTTKDSACVDAAGNSTNTLLNNLTHTNDSHNCFDNTWHRKEAQATKSTFNDFQIPETVSNYRQNRSRRTSERSIAPWPSLNLPQTGASERLKAELDPKDVEKAMKNLLKKPAVELAAGDEDGDTMLMCLVGNPVEFEKKKAYLVPLVERLGSVSGALTMTNNRREDALYLAAINCPQVAYVTGYLAAAMLQRGIDISQRLYHTKGDSLIHAVAAKGDSHGAVLAELLSLRTQQGTTVFDLSKRNYDGRTPLHVAIESHDPSGCRVSCIATTRLLLDNGADQKIKETKCGDTALHMAVSLSCDPALVQALLSNNDHEAVNIPNYNNNTPVHMAAALSKAVPLDRHIDVCVHLIRAGGLTNIQNRQGKSPLALVSAERKDAIRQIFHKKT